MNNKKVSVAIMAAGKGTRMYSNTPKVLHKISGFEMIYHVIKIAKEISDDIHVVLYHEHEKVKKTIKKYFDNINFCIQDYENYPGTGGTLRSIKPKYEKVLVLNGDMPLITKSALENLLNTNSKLCLAVFDAKDSTGYGRVVIEDKKVQRIVEEKDASEEIKKIKCVNAGIYLIETTFLKNSLPKLTNNNAQKEYYLTDLVLIAKKENIDIDFKYVKESECFGVNSKYQLSQAQDYMQEVIKRYWMEKGVSMQLPNTIFIASDVVFEGECFLESGVVLHNGVKIENSTIKANSVIESSTIINSHVGPLARVRPSSYIENSHVGNFVEVKNSTLKGVKAGHLSYLGDASIDDGTNVGCGTITCNYDGKNKYKTVIGKNVFIGSDTQLIAPITIEDDVIIAAGTTLKQNVKKGSLAITRAPLKIVENFFYTFFKGK